MRPVRGHQGRPVGICGLKAYWDIPGLSGPLKDWAKRDDTPKVLGGGNPGISRSCRILGMGVGGRGRARQDLREELA